MKRGLSDAVDSAHNGTAKDAKAAGKKRKCGAPSIVDVLVRDYADDWVKWYAHLEAAEKGTKLADAARHEVWDHLKGYRKKMDTWPQKEKRKAFRHLYRQFRPTPQSGTLSMLSSAPSVGSPLALPQLSSPVFQARDLHPADGLRSLSLEVNDEELQRRVDAALAALAATSVIVASANRSADASLPPDFLVAHTVFNSPVPGVILKHHIEQFHHCERGEQEPLLHVKRLVELEVNALVNNKGGHVVIGLDGNVVKGYSMTRKLRDNVRLAIDNQMDLWDPQPTLQDLVNVKFIDVKSPAGKLIAGHCVIWITVYPAQRPFRNSRGDIVRNIPHASEKPTPASFARPRGKRW